jgi:hypothetical protein
VTDAGGCSGSGDVTVSQKAPIVPTITLAGPGFCPGDSVRLTASPGYTRYLWSPGGETTQSIFAKAAGNYSVTVFDDDTCSGTSAPVPVIAYQPPKFNGAGITQQGEFLVADLDTVGGPKLTTYQWYQDGAPIVGGTGPSYRTVITADYTVTVTTVDGCVGTSPVFRPSASASSTVEIPTITASPGERVQVPIRLTASDNLDRNLVSRFQAKLRFNKQLLIPAEAGMVSVLEAKDRVVTIDGTRAIGTPTGNLVNLEFIAALGDTDRTPLVLESFRWLDTTNGSVLVTQLNGLFQLTGLCETGGKRLLDVSGAVRLKAVRPNPTSGLTDLEYEVVERGHTRLFLVDMYGSAAAVLVDGEIQPGSYVVQVDASRLPSGTYVCVLQTPSQRKTQIMQVVR